MRKVQVNDVAEFSRDITRVSPGSVETDVQKKMCEDEGDTIILAYGGITAKGCSESDARRALDMELLDLGMNRCDDPCKHGGECVMILDRNDADITCYPARLADCPDRFGYVCEFKGEARCRCKCVS